MALCLLNTPPCLAFQPPPQKVKKNFFEQKLKNFLDRNQTHCLSLRQDYA